MAKIYLSDSIDTICSSLDAVLTEAETTLGRQNSTDHYHYTRLRASVDTVIRLYESLRESYRQEISAIEDALNETGNQEQAA